MKKDKTFRPDRVLSYFKAEWLPLAFVTLSGLVYNIGLLATPWFEGRLAQCLADILGSSETAAKMAMLVLAYIVVTLAVQAARFIKRFYVRRFANNINRRMKGILYMPARVPVQSLPPFLCNVIGGQYNPMPGFRIPAYSHGTPGIFRMV